MIGRMEVNIHAAKTHFSKLLRKVAEGEEVTISKAGVPVARLIPVTGPAKPRVLGLARGSVWMAHDFDAQLPDDILAGFYGEKPRPRKRK
jgi:prevent-host-death family protein